MSICQSSAQYYNANTGDCQNCLQYCSSCLNGSSCLQCMPGYIPFVNQTNSNSSVICLVNGKSLYFECFGNSAECSLEENLITILETFFLCLLSCMILLWVVLLLKKKARPFSMIYSISSFQQLGLLYLFSLQILGVSNLFFNRLYQLFNFFPTIPSNFLNQLISSQLSHIETDPYDLPINTETNSIVLDIMKVFKLKLYFLDNTIYLLIAIAAVVFLQIIIQQLSKLKASLILDQLTFRPANYYQGMLLLTTQLIVNIVVQCCYDENHFISSIPNIVIWTICVLIVIAFYLKLLGITKRMASNYFQTEEFIKTYQPIFEGIKEKRYYFIMESEAIKILNISLIMSLKEQQLLCTILLFVISFLSFISIMKKNPFKNGLMRSYIIFDKILDLGMKILLVCISYTTIRIDESIIKFSTVLILFLLFTILLNCVFSFLSYIKYKPEKSEFLLPNSSSSNSSNSNSPPQSQYGSNSS